MTASRSEPTRPPIPSQLTSNPTPQYVQRVAEKFNNDGTGKRGNLAAVVRAILLDGEARIAPLTFLHARALPRALLHLLLRKCHCLVHRHCVAQ